MFEKKASPVQVGNQFVKTGGSQRIWTVTGIANDHARLISKQGSSENITISVNALEDRSLFLRFVPDPVRD